MSAHSDWFYHALCAITTKKTGIVPKPVMSSVYQFNSVSSEHYNFNLYKSQDTSC